MTDQYDYIMINLPNDKLTTETVPIWRISMLLC